MEFIRIFTKKRLVVLLLLFIANGLFFIRECSDAKIYRIYDAMLLETDKRTEDDDMKKAVSSVIIEFRDAYKESAEYDEYSEAKAYLLEKIEYVENYSDSIAQKIGSSKVLLKSSLYSDKSSFSYLNIVKTTKDLESIKDAEVTLSNGIWLEKVSNYKLIYYFIMIMVVMMIYSMVEDKKTKIIYLQYAAKNGRGKLFLKRLFIFIGMTLCITVLFFTEVSVISLYTYGGIEGIGDSVCSDELFALCSMCGESRIVWLFINVIKAALTFVVLGVCLWAFLSGFNNSNIGLYAFILLYCIEVVLNRVITAKSIFRIFKYINIKYLIDCSDVWFVYNNWGYDGIVTDISESTMLLLAVVCVISIIMITINSLRCNPLTKMGFIEKFLLRIYDGVIKVFAKLPVGVMELFKLVYTQKIGIVVIAILILFVNMKKGYVLSYNVSMSAMVELCESQRLSSTEELAEKRSELVVEREAYKGDIDAAQKIEILDMQIDYLDYIIEKRNLGVDVSTISQYEYESAFGKKQTSNQQYIAMLCIVVMLVSNIGAVSYERKCGVISNIRASKNRVRWIVKKILYATILASVITLFIYGWYYVCLVKLYRLEDYGVSIQSLMMFKDYPFDIPIWGFVAIDMLLKLILLVAVGGIAFAISSVFSYDIGYFVGIIVILPHLLCELGITALSYVSLPKIMAFMPYWVEGKVAYNIIADIVIIGIGIAGYLYGYYRTVIK